jgi:O-antigen ligase
MEKKLHYSKYLLFSKIFSFVILFLILFSPPISVPFFSFKLQLIDFVFPFLFVWIVSKKINQLKLAYISNILLFIAVMFISILINWKHNFLNDFFEIYDLLKYIAIFIFFKENFFPKLNYLAIDIAFIIFLIFNLFHYHDILGFNEKVMPFFCGKNNIHLLTFGLNALGLPDTKRMIGIVGNPNNNAILFLMFLIRYLPHNNWKTKNMIFFYLALIAVSACQSRTGLIAFIAIIILNFIVIKWKWWKITLHSAITISFLFLFFNLNAFSEYFQIDFLKSQQKKNDYVMSLFNKEGFQGTSWQKRLQIWKGLLIDSSEKPLFGHGPRKNFFYQSQLYSENEYVQVIWRFGLFGLIVYLGIFLIPLRNVLKSMRVDTESKNIAFMIVLFLITSITNVPLSNTILAPFFFSFMGSFYAGYKQNTDLYYFNALKKRFLNKSNKNETNSKITNLSNS